MIKTQIEVIVGEVWEWSESYWKNELFWDLEKTLPALK